MRKHPWIKKLSEPALWTGLAVGASLVFFIFEFPYVNFRKAAAPVDELPLVIRRDAKGDGRFGTARSGNRRHRGIDIQAPLNSPVRAIRSGTVVQVGNHRGLGLYVELDHKKELQSLYAHLNAVSVEPGKRIQQGQLLGTVGKTGNAKSPLITPHLHLEIVKDKVPIDPALIGLRVADVRTPAVPGAAEADGTGGE